MQSTAEHDWYASHLAQLQAKSRASETDLREHLISPVLTRVLGFKIGEVDAEKSIQGGGTRGRPDYICRHKGAGRASVIVEVKQLGTDLYRRTGRQWHTAPVGQLQQYLDLYRGVSTGTWGILTNGTEWIVVQREGSHFDESALPRAPLSALRLDEVKRVLEPVRRASDRRVVRSGQPTLGWLLDLAEECESPDGFIADALDRLELEPLRTGGAPNVAWAALGQSNVAGQLFEQDVYLACLNLDFPDGQIAPQDIAKRLKVQQLSGRIIGIAYNTSTARRLCRSFLREGGRLFATALIDPQLPGSRAEHQFEELARLCTKNSVDAAIQALDAEPLKKEFHEAVSSWFKRIHGGRNELRHLIRILFVWLLQQRSIVPGESLWQVGRQPPEDNPHAIHDHVEWLFTQILAQPVADRGSERDAWRSDLRLNVPYLNGSLFTKSDRSEAPQRLTNQKYLELFSILRRFDWTLDDRTGIATEAAIDPSMLGDLFERLVLDADGVRVESDGRKKMPGGTYYTPQDIVDEMVADAIAGWVSHNMKKSEGGGGFGQL